MPGEQRKWPLSPAQEAPAKTHRVAGSMLLKSALSARSCRSGAATGSKSEAPGASPCSLHSSHTVRMPFTEGCGNVSQGSVQQHTVQNGCCFATHADAAHKAQQPRRTTTHMLWKAAHHETAATGVCGGQGLPPVRLRMWRAAPNKPASLHHWCDVAAPAAC